MPGRADRCHHHFPRGQRRQRFSRPHTFHANFHDTVYNTGDLRGFECAWIVSNPKNVVQRQTHVKIGRFVEYGVDDWGIFVFGFLYYRGSAWSAAGRVAYDRTTR